MGSMEERSQNWVISMVCAEGNGKVVEVALLHDDVLLLGELVGAGDLGRFDLYLVRRAEAAVAEAGVAGAVDGDEGDVLALGGGVELDGDGDHPEADEAFPDSSSCHDRTSLGCAPTPWESLCDAGCYRGLRPRAPAWGAKTLMLSQRLEGGQTRGGGRAFRPLLD